jgi:cell division protein FtsB
MKMLEKIKSSQTVKSLSDVRSLGMIAFGIIALLVTWSSIKVVQTNYDLQKQISAMQQVNDVQQLANNNLKLKNQYFNSNEYLELAARRHFNKAAPGEKLLIIPKEVALAHSIDVPKPKKASDVVTDTAKASGSSAQHNFDAWLDFLFHRS